VPKQYSGVYTMSTRWRLRERDDLAADNERKPMTSEPFESSYRGAQRATVLDHSITRTFVTKYSVSPKQELGIH
jgi:hypothetical protein